ncbi:2-oxoglutarate and iron-dependent oxygenase domain-containing protein [Streptomyces sp. ME18-1-4]|uniref:2-oxoglutarate and iron-dependent oxygenase domain-containing protein n=1 Tax=Streptomyces sp. ME18-1-4 TaxID=3028685 RepID=UPI0029A0BC3F|nr:2-oxoglutarate and iron-dependent oxygenase domain-containing protein [Streptomyces sp. ME18-1-4]MDX3243623.1 2OG-Fe(II) oxygenase family protein [Streptomyces sp. ME18-1-4]
MSDLVTFDIPERVTGLAEDIELGQRMVKSWQRDGIYQVSMRPAQETVVANAYAASRKFFTLPLAEKSGFVSDLSYSGYVASGEEVTDGVQDGSEIFTVTKDVPLDDPRVAENWPCHGPVPWPSQHYQQAVNAYMDQSGSLGHRILQLTALGLGQDIDALTRLTDDGWHHMRVLRFPSASATSDRGIGAHTDYGLLVIATQDEVGQALYIRPPIEGESRNRNWLPEESAAGVFEDDDHWTYVKPVPSTFTVFPGDLLQFITGGELLSTPHKVKLADKERYAFAYFHEPSFQAVARPLGSAESGDEESLHYGSHFTNMFLRCYPDRVTTRRIHAEDRLSVLAKLREKATA